MKISQRRLDRVGSRVVYEHTRLEHASSRQETRALLTGAWREVIQLLASR